MTCRSCLERRKKLQKLRDEKKAKRQGIQASALGAIVAASEAVGKILGEEKEDGRESNVSEKKADQP